MKTLKGLILPLLLVFLLVSSVSAQSSMSFEIALIDSLMKNYNNQIRPSPQVNGEYVIFFNQIVSLDSLNQVMTSSSYIYIHWLDKRLEWDPSENEDITKIVMPG
jgi:hypothetical protein